MNDPRHCGTDSTEIEQHALLKEQARRLATLLGNLDGVAYRCRDDSQWTMEFVSEGCQRLTGYPPQDLLLNSRVSYEEITHADDRGRVREVIRAALAAGRRFDVEYRIVRADGTVRWVWERGTAVHDGDGMARAIEGFIQDVTERREAAEALAEAERRYRSIFENAIEGIFQTSIDGHYLDANPALARIYGYDTSAELIAAVHDIGSQLYVEPGRRSEFIHRMREEGRLSGFESQVYRRDGSVIWISENARVVRDAEGHPLLYEGTVEDITERRRYEAEIERQATHDALTGLPNRSLLHDRLRQALLYARRDGEPVVVAFIDLDHFKIVNDSLGHGAGDELLKMIATRLRHCVREADTVARLGGDEFVLMMAGLEPGEALDSALQRALAAVREPWVHHGRELAVSCSVGVSVFPQDGENPDTLLRHADSAMYKAKETGRDNVQYFTSELSARISRRLEMHARLRRALDLGQFLLHYQPRVELDGNRLVGAEALIRWETPEEGLVPPANFIPVAEEIGLIVPIGEWVLATACAQARDWQRAGRPVGVSVNISARQFGHNDLVATVAHVLRETGLAPELLELELTESLVMHDAERFVATLHELKALGVQIAVDDFGTGYSSLSYLKRFPVDRLKIDRSFVRDVVSDRDDAAIAEAIITLGHTLNLKVVAEGVETAEQVEFLQARGCDEVQGWLFGRPIPARAFSALLAERPG